MSKGKKYSAAIKLIDVDKMYSPNSALNLLGNGLCEF